MATATGSSPTKSCRCGWGSTTGLSVPCPESRANYSLLCRACDSGIHTQHDRQVAVQQGLFSPTPWKLPEK